MKKQFKLYKFSMFGGYAMGVIAVVASSPERALDHATKIYAKQFPGEFAPVDAPSLDPEHMTSYSLEDGEGFFAGYTE